MFVQNRKMAILGRPLGLSLFALLAICTYAGVHPKIAEKGVIEHPGSEVSRKNIHGAHQNPEKDTRSSMLLHSKRQEPTPATPATAAAEPPAAGAPAAAAAGAPAAAGDGAPAAASEAPPAAQE